MSRERRIHARVRTRIHACLRFPASGEVVEGVIENVGEGGVFFATEVLEVLVDDGAEVIVEFEGTRAGALVPFRVPSTVLRTERYFDGAAVVRAFAIRFVESQALGDVTFEG